MPQKPEDRDYKKEYKNYHSKPDQIKKRSTRNKARRKMEKKGKVRKGDGKEVDHRIPLSKGGSNSAGNLRVVSRKENRKKYDGGSRKRKSQTKSRAKKKYKAKTPSQKRRVAEKVTARVQPLKKSIRDKGVTGPKHKRR
ncbi:HNH endonuclease signature motif containing protein [Gracilimonas sp. Q87]|uniref:HNH endonuclease signature motif containing protein n=1 Tax=Gracilimonas sp. Q87 TaxID=3384766 RepID=UPI00398437DE